MMPQRFMSKLDTHKIQFQGRTITVKVVDEAAMVSPYLAELKSLIGTSTAVGLRVRHVDLNIGIDCNYPSILLQLSVGTRCLLIQLRYFDSIPECLQKEFLADPEVCFVGVTRSDRRKLKTYCEIELTNGIDVSDLAAKVLKKNFGSGCGLEEIAASVGVSLPEHPGSDKNIDIGDNFHTRDEIKRIVYNVYGAHLIGTELLDML